MITVDPITFREIPAGEKVNRTCGDCGKERCLTLHYENEYGRLNHGVCHSCWSDIGIEECEGGLIGSVYDGLSDKELKILEKNGRS